MPNDTSERIFTMDEVENEIQILDDEGFDELRNTSNDRIEVVLINKYPQLQGFGMDISGGKDRPHTKDDPGIFISALRSKGLAEKSGKIEVGDKIVAVNGTDVSCVTHDDAVKLFVADRMTVTLSIQKYAMQLLRAASVTPTSTNGTLSPDSERSTTPRRDTQPTERDNSVSITGFMLGLAIGCASVFLLRRYLSSKS